MGLKSCRAFLPRDINNSLSVSRIRLPRASKDLTGVFYTTSLAISYHAFAYDDADQQARIVMLDEADRIVKTVTLGARRVEGVSFDLSGEHLVVLLGSDPAAMFVKLALPDLKKVFQSSFESPMVIN